MALRELRDGRQRLGALTETVLRVGFPIQRTISFRTLHLHDAIQLSERAIPPRLGNRVIPCRVDLGLAFPLSLALLGLTLSLLGFPIPPFHFAVPVPALFVEQLEPAQQSVEQRFGDELHRPESDRAYFKRARTNRHRSGPTGPGPSDQDQSDQDQQGQDQPGRDQSGRGRPDLAPWVPFGCPAPRRGQQTPARRRM